MMGKPKKSEEDLDNPEPRKVECCCCDCKCSDEATQDETCCICAPIKCGIHTIGYVAIALALYLTLNAMTQYLNIYFAWWYTTILIAIYVFVWVGVYFFWRFIYFKSYKDQKDARGKLVLACILVLIGLVAALVWTVFYITQIYDQPEVYTTPEPWDEDSYIKQSHK